MKKLSALLFVLLAIFGQVTVAQDQGSPLRVLVLPFDATRSFEPFGLGLATGLQRSLNSLEGVYAPAVAEAGLFVTRAFEAELEAVQLATEAFGADVVISGAVSGSGDRLSVTIVFAGPLFPANEEIQFEVSSEPGAALEGVALEVAPRLGLEGAQAVERLRSLAREAPELTSLGSLARATSRLGSGLGELTAAAELNPESSWALAEHARALALAGRNEEALQSASRAVEANPDDAEAQVVRGIVANASGMTSLAQQSFQAAIELNPDHALALVGLAGTTEDPSYAQTLLDQALDSSPRQVEAVLNLAQLEPDHQRALQRLRRASQYLPDSVALHRAFMSRAIAAGDSRGALAYLRDVTENPLAASPALYAQAELLSDELVDDALTLVRSGRERFPESSGLQLTEAELLLRAGRQEEGIAALEELRTAFPESVEVANTLAVALAQAGEVERAREVFAAVADGSTIVQVNLARALLQGGHARAALTTLEPLLSEFPEDAEVHTLYGVALGRIGRVEESLAALERALELDPQSEEALRTRTLLEQQQRITGDDAVAFEGEAATAFENGLYALETGDTDEAITSFARAFELSEHPLAAFYHGYALQRAGRAREAIGPYQIAVAAYPESDTVLNNLGYAHLQLGRLDLALDTLRQAVTANQENANVHVNLGLTYYGLARYDEAVAAWERAVELDPGLEDDLAEIRGRAQEQRGPE